MGRGGVSDDIQARRAALDARFPVWEPVTLSGFLTRSAQSYRDRPFVITDERTASYAEIDAWASRLADGLAALGVRPGDRVGVVMANYLEFVPVKFAIARAGAVAIPFNYLYRQDELGYVLRQSRCGVLVTMTGFGGLDYPAMLDAIAPGWAEGPTAELPDLRRVVLLGTGGTAVRDGVLDVAGLAELGAGNPGLADAAAVTPDSPGDILYTSGTTGLPKGVVVTHDAVLRTSYGSALTRAYQDGRRILFSLPCYHMFGYVEGLLSVMFVGGAIIPRTAFSPADYFASIGRHQATEILAVPTMTVALLEHPGRAGYDLSSLTAILSGAAPAPVWVWQKVRSELGITEITTGYGMTECGGAMTLTLPEDPLEFHAATVGRPKLAGSAGVPGTGDLCVYKTVDPLTGEDLPAGAEGELHLDRSDAHAGLLGQAGRNGAGAARRLGALRRPRRGPARRVPAGHRAQQGAVQERRRAGDAEGGRGPAYPAPRGQPGLRGRGGRRALGRRRLRLDRAGARRGRGRG